MPKTKYLIPRHFPIRTYANKKLTQNFKLEGQNFLIKDDKYFAAPKATVLHMISKVSKPNRWSIPSLKQNIQITSKITLRYNTDKSKAFSSMKLSNKARISY